MGNRQNLERVIFAMPCLRLGAIFYGALDPQRAICCVYLYMILSWQTFLILKVTSNFDVYFHFINFDLKVTLTLDFWIPLNLNFSTCPLTFDCEVYVNFRSSNFLYISNLKIPLTIDLKFYFKTRLGNIHSISILKNPLTLRCL